MQLEVISSYFYSIQQMCQDTEGNMQLATQ